MRPAGPDHRLIERAQAVLQTPPADTPADLITVYADGLGAIRREIGERQASDPTFAETLAGAASVLADRQTDDRTASEAIWSVLYPEAVGLQANISDSVAALRRRRIVQVDQPNPRPIVDAAREVLFTSNVLLGLPLEAPVADSRDLDPAIAAAVARARTAPQRYWFDHPIPIGVAPAANELLHGLRGLDAAIRAEQALLGAQPNRATGRLTCLLSASVTHPELRDIARRYVEVELGREKAFDHVDVVVASETDVRQFVDEVILPAMARFTPSVGDPVRMPAGIDVLGVDGEYGRHYSFLKAIAAIWQVFIDPGIRATFKIDLDQVFPQPELVAETGRTAFQHLETPLWGARGRDADGRPVELGMIAGALVNAGDIARGLFTSDVPVPDGPRRPSDHVFFSALPQAISTQAEMMERYDTPSPDGIGTALERIHVTGGTNGILVEALRRHRPFTPSFIGRAEDQAYALSVQGEDGPRLAYAHAAGLIMRHDKAAYAGAAIDAAHVGKLVGDDVRILTFSAYATAIADARASDGSTVASIKSLMDPFTGGFISRLPMTSSSFASHCGSSRPTPLGNPRLAAPTPPSGRDAWAKRFDPPRIETVSAPGSRTSGRNGIPSTTPWTPWRLRWTPATAMHLSCGAAPASSSMDGASGLGLSAISQSAADGRRTPSEPRALGCLDEDQRPIRVLRRRLVPQWRAPDPSGGLRARGESGSVEGKTLLHLQCHFGLDTLSWARLGATVTGGGLQPRGDRDRAGPGGRARHPGDVRRGEPVRPPERARWAVRRRLHVARSPGLATGHRRLGKDGRALRQARWLLLRDRDPSLSRRCSRTRASRRASCA